MRRRVPAFANHNRADYVRRHVAPEIWSSYYKFCFERNPWDKVVSFYYWRWRGKEAMPFRDFVMSNAPLSLRDSGGWPIYGDDDGLLVDRVYRYEDIAEASAEIVERLGLPGELDLIRQGAVPQGLVAGLRGAVRRRDRGAGGGRVRKGNRGVRLHLRRRAAGRSTGHTTGRGNAGAGTSMTGRNAATS